MVPEPHIPPITRADEQGLRGVSLDIQLRRVFAALPEDALRSMARELRAESARREMTYQRDGHDETINVMLRPLAISPEQFEYYHKVALTILGALKRMPDLYLENDWVREILPLTEGEREWLQDTWGPLHRKYHTVLGRLDAVADITSAFPKEGLAFIEPNLVGVGGIHLSPTTEHLVLDCIMPTLRNAAPDLDLEAPYDLRDLFIHEVERHARAIGRAGRTLCLVDAKYSGDGPDELETLTPYYRKLGWQVYHADPEELELAAGEVWFEGHCIDLVYRDYETRELADLEREGKNMQPLKHLLRQNQVISSLAGDLDHKSCFEVFTNPLFASYFSPEERAVFDKHILWTRVVRDTGTTNERGQAVNLLEFLRDNREEMVRKPNRSYGGENVLLGPAVSQGEWEAALERGVREPGEWVAQRLAPLPTYEFPVLSDDLQATTAAFYVVIGLTPTVEGLSILGRASQRQVVNVAQRGGMLAVLVGKHAPGITAPLPPTALDFLPA